MNRRSFGIAALTSPLWGTSLSALADSGAITRLLVGFQAGGSFDTLARILAPVLQSELKRQMIVENRTGASGRIALEAARNAKPDGEAFVVAPQGAMTLFPYVYKNLSFDPVKDFTPISRLVSFDYALTVNTSIGVRNLAEYIAWLKANPGKASYASAGAGTTPHFLGVAFHRAVGVPGVHVGYRGAAAGLVDVAGGRIPAMFSLMADTIQSHRAGSLRIIATTGSARSSFLPDVPTLKESGVDVVVPGWIGLYGPAGMSAELQSTYQRAVAVAMKLPQTQERLEASAMVGAPSTSAELRELQQTELAYWGPVVKASGFTPEE